MSIKKMLIVCGGIFLLIGSIYFFFKGTLNPILIMLLICPLMHLFMHKGHHKK